MQNKSVINEIISEAAQLRKSGKTWKQVREDLVKGEPENKKIVPVSSILNSMVLRAYPTLRVRAGNVVDESKKIKILQNILESNVKDKEELCRAILELDR